MSKPGVTPEQIVDAATRLTAEHGLDGWSVRQLAAALGAWPAVVYHHVGDREAVVRAVTERVVSHMPCPAADLAWREWFRRLLVDGRVVLRCYRGVARRLIVRGPTVPSALRVIDRGIQVLRLAGLGDEAVSAYSMLLNNAFLLVALEDDREGNPAARQAAIEVLRTHRGDVGQPGLALMGDTFDRMADDPGRQRTYYAEFYDYTVERSLDGIQARLIALS